MELVLAAVSLVLSLLCLGATVFLILHRVEVDDVRSQVRSLSLDVADVVDRLAIWQRRDAARARSVARDDPAGSGANQAQLFQLDGTSRKAAIRQRLAALKGGSQ